MNRRNFLKGILYSIPVVVINGLIKEEMPIDNFVAGSTIEIYGIEDEETPKSPWKSTTRIDSYEYEPTQRRLVFGNKEGLIYLDDSEYLTQSAYNDMLNKLGNCKCNLSFRHVTPCDDNVTVRFNPWYSNPNSDNKFDGISHLIDKES